jgi:hypothetical protein
MELTSFTIHLFLFMTLRAFRYAAACAHSATLLLARISFHSISFHSIRISFHSIRIPFHSIPFHFHSISFHSISLAFPPLATFQACNKCRHWLICRTSLKLVIRAFLRFALIAREIVRRSLNVRFVFLFIANLLVFNELLPFGRTYLLMGHERQVLWFDITGCHCT